MTFAQVKTPNRQCKRTGSWFKNDVQNLVATWSSLLREHGIQATESIAGAVPGEGITSSRGAAV